MLGICFMSGNEDRITKTFGPFDWIEQAYSQLRPANPNGAADDAFQDFAWYRESRWVLGTDTGPDYVGREYTDWLITPWQGHANENVNP
jgi:hypothetical protein